MKKEGYLHKYFLNNGGKIIHKWIHYFDVYERYFNKFTDREIFVLEIGVFEGGSLDMWRDYFGKSATIVGIDINPNCKKYEGDGVFVEIGDQSDTNFLNEIIKKYGKPDIVIDDGSHLSIHQKASFEYLYDKMKDDSIYLVEDLHCAYWPEFNGGLRSLDSFIEFAKKKIDEINAIHIREGQPITRFTETTKAMHVYDSIIVFERLPQSRKFYTKTGGLGVLKDLTIGNDINK